MPWSSDGQLGGVCVCKTVSLGAEGVAQWVESLPSTTEAGGVPAGGPGVQGQCLLPSELQASQGYPLIL